LLEKVRKFQRIFAEIDFTWIKSNGSRAVFKYQKAQKLYST